MSATKGTHLSPSQDLLLQRYTNEHLKKIDKLQEKLGSRVSPFLRWTVFTVNMVFWVAGLLMIMLGIWAFVQKTHTQKSRTVKSIVDVLTDIAIVLAVLGLIIFTIAFAGCVGVLRQNVPMLKFYRMTLLVILGIQMLTIAAIVVFSTLATQYIKNFAKVTAIARYRDDIDLQNFVDWIQLSMGCCGVSEEAYLDWNGNRYFRCNKSNPSTERCSVPFSCCIAPNDIDRNIVNTRCAYKVLEKDAAEIHAIVYPYGCFSKFVSTIKEQAVYSVVGLVVYMLAYLVVIDTIERLTSQIERFQEEWFRAYAKNNSIDAVKIEDLVEKEYKKQTKKQNDKSKSHTKLKSSS